MSSVQFGNPIAFLGVPQVFSGSLNGPGVSNAGPFSIPNNTRTVFISLPQNVVLINNLYVVGATGYIYRFGGVPYLTNLLVLQISGAVESSIYIQIGFTGPGNIPINVYTDNVVTLESSLYNGISKAATSTLANAGTTTVLNGPARLLALSVRSAVSTVFAGLYVNGDEIISAQATTSQISSSLSLPPNFILDKGSAVQLLQVGAGAGAGASTGSVQYAYP